MLRNGCFLLAIVFFLTCCGGGGGGGAPEGSPSAVSISLNPDRIDSGDRLTVRVQLTDIRASEVNGIVIKLRYPTGLDVIESSSLTSVSGDESVPIDPEGFRGDPNDFLLFFLDTARVDLNNRQAWIEFDLEGTEAIENGRVGVDVDAADADNRESFDINDPRFSAVSERVLNVTEDELPTPTPTATPTSTATPAVTPTAASS